MECVHDLSDSVVILMQTLFFAAGCRPFIDRSRTEGKRLLPAKTYLSLTIAASASASASSLAFHLLPSNCR